jgi:hypothetical protein
MSAGAFVSEKATNRSFETWQSQFALLAAENDVSDGAPKNDKGKRNRGPDRQYGFVHHHPPVRRSMIVIQSKIPRNGFAPLRSTLIRRCCKSGADWQTTFHATSEIWLAASRILHLSPAQLSPRTLSEAVAAMSSGITRLYLHVDLDALVRGLMRTSPVCAVSLTAYDPAFDSQSRAPPIAIRAH